MGSWAALSPDLARKLGRAGGSAGPVPFLIFGKSNFFIIFTDLTDVCDFHI
jgi:hypothetical protein